MGIFGKLFDGEHFRAGFRADAHKHDAENYKEAQGSGQAAQPAPRRKRTATSEEVTAEEDDEA